MAKQLPILLVATSLLIFTHFTFSQIQRGSNINGELAADNFGGALCMPNANTIAIGARGNDGNGNGSGHVRIYEWNGNSWIQKGHDIDGEAAANFSGWSVSMPDENTVAIGARSNDGIGGIDCGQTRIFKWNGISWIQKGADIDGEMAGDGFGVAVSMPTPYTVAGGANFNNLNTGHARIFDFCTPTTGIDTQSSCNSFTWIDGITYTTNNNTAVFTLVNAAGCDSTVTLNLSIVSLNPSIVLTGSTFSATPSGAAYQWLDCSNESAILLGETSQNFTPTENGLYSVVVTQNGCVDTSSFLAIDFLNLFDFHNESHLIHIPNPLGDHNVINFNKLYSSINYIFTDITGRVVLTKNLQNTDKMEFELNAPTGIYYLKIHLDNSYSEYKLMKL
jgi:hypothetical protein